MPDGVVPTIIHDHEQNDPRVITMIIGNKRVHNPSQPRNNSAFQYLSTKVTRCSNTQVQKQLDVAISEYRSNLTFQYSIVPRY